MNMVARVKIQSNPEREAVADDFESVFVGEYFGFICILHVKTMQKSPHYEIAPPAMVKS
jgi:hypothetical protein